MESQQVTLTPSDGDAAGHSTPITEQVGSRHRLQSLRSLSILVVTACLLSFGLTTGAHAATTENQDWDQIIEGGGTKKHRGANDVDFVTTVATTVNGSTRTCKVSINHSFDEIVISGTYYTTTTATSRASAIKTMARNVISGADQETTNLKDASTTNGLQTTLSYTVPSTSSCVDATPDSDADHRALRALPEAARIVLGYVAAAAVAVVMATTYTLLAANPALASILSNPYVTTAFACLTTIAVDSTVKYVAYNTSPNWASVVGSCLLGAGPAGFANAVTGQLNLAVEERFVTKFAQVAGAGGRAFAQGAWDGLKTGLGTWK